MSASRTPWDAGEPGEVRRVCGHRTTPGGRVCSSTVARVLNFPGAEDDSHPVEPVDNLETLPRRDEARPSPARRGRAVLLRQAGSPLHPAAMRPPACIIPTLTDVSLRRYLYTRRPVRV